MSVHINKKYITNGRDRTVSFFITKSFRITVTLLLSTSDILLVRIIKLRDFWKIMYFLITEIENFPTGFENRSLVSRMRTIRTVLDQ